MVSVRSYMSMVVLQSVFLLLLVACLCTWALSTEVGALALSAVPAVT
jgi:hypothetical protein